MGLQSLTGTLRTKRLTPRSSLNPRMLALALGALVAACQSQNAQDAAQQVCIALPAQVCYEPEVEIQNESYVEARSRFHTRLLRTGPAPQEWTPLTPPPGVAVVKYASDGLQLRAWVNRPSRSDHRRYPAVLFLHGGYAFAMSDWQDAQQYRDAGFIVMAPILRGENGQPGVY